MSGGHRLLEPVSITALPGWQQDQHDEALGAFQLSVKEILSDNHGFKRSPRFGSSLRDWIDVCKTALAADSGKSFFENHFVAFRVNDPENPNGLFTGYFEPEAEGNLHHTTDFPVPIYGKPSDLTSFDQVIEEKTGLKYGRLVNGQPQAYFSRQEIEEGALRGRGLELAWLKSWVDAFFIHIQGSGRVRLPDGSTLRLAYRAKSGLPYTGIGGVLVDKGAFSRERSSMQSIRAWMAENPAEMRALMWQNKSFVFFRTIDVADDRLGALGAQQVNLTPRRSLAVDRNYWMFGMPVWIDTRLPPEVPGGAKPFRRLMIAQDTGSAIKGYARGDIYWGWGDLAAQIAGHMKSVGRMTVLLPRRVASGLGLVE